MKKLIALLTLPLALQACSSIDHRPARHAAQQDAVIEAIRQENADIAMLLETLRQQQAQESGLFESVVNLAAAGVAFANPASGVTSGVSVLLALSGMQQLNADPEQPITFVYQGQGTATTGTRSSFATIQAYRQAMTDLAELDGSMARAVLKNYANEMGMSGLHTALTEGVSSPADLQGMCTGLAALGSQVETIYDSLKVPGNLAGSTPLMHDGVTPSDSKPLQASL